jgi:dTDP-L-rhamnose 4-epimerase
VALRNLGNAENQGRCDLCDGCGYARDGRGRPMDRILIRGGAGFIDRHVALTLLERGSRVLLIDAMIGQVHVNESTGVLPPEVQLKAIAVRTDQHRADQLLSIAVHIAVPVAGAA